MSDGVATMGMRYSSLIAHHPSLVLGAAYSLLSGSPRSLAMDAAEVVDTMDPPPRFENLEAIPATDPFLLVANHFQSPRWWIGWVALAITDAVARARRAGNRDLHWAIISEWRWLEISGLWIPNPLTSLLFPRACRVWGQIAMPARPSDVAGRARALRQMLEWLGLREGRSGAFPEPVGLFPEGRATSSLEEARPGTGSFLHRVSRMGVPLMPVGVRQEEDGALVAAFGAPYRLGDPPVDRGEDLDDWARRRVMVSVARLLPREMWGAYAAAVEQAE